MILTRIPFYLKTEPKHKWKDFIYFVSGGGSKPTQKTYRFKNGRYELIKEIEVNNTFYYNFYEQSKKNKNLELIFSNVYEKIYKKNI